MIYSIPCVTIAIITIASGCDWSYDDTTAWDEEGVMDEGETNYCGTSYTEQSPINIQTSSAISCSDDQQTLDWQINEDITTFQVQNTGHSIKITPISDDESDDENDIFGKLVNNFQTSSGEHSEYCLDSFHIHWGQTSETGSEHLLNDNQYAMEMHFIHYSCDYDDITAAFNANPTDPYVLAVVGIFFTVGDENEFIKQISDNVLNLRDYGNEISISGVSMTSLVNEDDDDGRNYYQYEGSLTTPPCSPIVSWHVMEEPMTISEAQLDALRTNIYSDCDTLMAPNFRPTQTNENSVHYCQGSDD